LHKIQKRRTGVPIDGRESKRQLGVGADLMKDEDGLMDDGEWVVRFEAAPIHCSSAFPLGFCCMQKAFPTPLVVELCRTIRSQN
jgi:hypothetical protein